MKYALNLAEDKRILSAWVVLPNGNYDGMPIVDTLPTVGKEGKEADITNYFYINNQFIYDPKPDEPEPTPGPTVWDELDAAYQTGYDAGYQEGVNTAYDE